MSGRAPRREAARVMLPLLDRLIDESPGVELDAPMSVAEAEQALRRSVRRDLEALLNARRRWLSWPAAFTELRTSPLAFGTPDFASGAFSTRQARQALCQEIEDTIRRFEPRFVSVRVLLTEDAATQDAVLRMRIEALLHADPAPEPISFDTLLDSTTADVVVRAGDGR